MTLLLLVAVTLGAVAQAGGSMSGTILDPSGAPVPNALVRLEAANHSLGEFTTGSDGRFQFAIESTANLRVIVTAGGFAQATALANGRPMEITLQPAPFFEEVNVTSSRADRPKADPTVTMTVISSTDLMTAGALTLDDTLKLVPGFTLFRRTSSRTANPTTQGVALRGIGGTAQSRSLVLADGIPLNDAFGGWVYWSRVPQAAIDHVEVQRGSGSDLYGADAVGGVIQLLTLRPSRTSGRAILEGGTLGTGRVSVFGGGAVRGWHYAAGGEWFTIDGYIPVATEQDPGIAPRGPIDAKLGSRHRSALGSAGYQAANGWRVDMAGNVFDEHRDNATPASINTTASRQFSTEAAGGVGRGLLNVRFYAGTQDYRQTFTTVNASRSAEALNRDQNVPSTAIGVGGQWFREWGRHALLVGAEGRYVDGASIETPYSQGRALATTEAGGTQHLGSAFMQDTYRVSDRVTLVLGAHGDGWRSQSHESGFTKSSGSFNPRLSAAYRAGESITIRGAVYHGFRAPTLNEFYRNFSAGSTQTRPNEALNPERLTGGDLGVMVGRGRISARVTGFWNVLDDAITSVTLSSTPQLIVRQRANADKVRAAGLEIESEIVLPRSLSVAFSSGFVSSNFNGDTELRGKRVPQVPSYNLGLDLRYRHAAWAASAQLRVTGPQFEDDQNVFTLRRATVVDVFGSRRVARGLTAFVAIENLFDATYDVGRTPILTTGVPRSARAGVQIALP